MVDFQAQAVLTGLNIQHGKDLSNGFGGILNTGTLTVTDSTITNNNITTTVGPNLVPGNSGSQSQARTNYVPGWTGGLGVEYAVWGGLFVRGEWEYTKFLSIMNTSLSMNNVRAAIGYKF